MITWLCRLLVWLFAKQVPAQIIAVGARCTGCRTPVLLGVLTKDDVAEGEAVTLTLAAARCERCGGLLEARGIPVRSRSREMVLEEGL